jgi:hypothetical protein
MGESVNSRFTNCPIREFAAKLHIVNEEVDECVYWLELITRHTPPPAPGLTLLREARELRAIFAKARATTRIKLARRHTNT